MKGRISPRLRRALNEHNEDYRAMLKRLGIRPCDCPNCQPAKPPPGFPPRDAKQTRECEPL